MKLQFLIATLFLLVLCVPAKAQNQVSPGFKAPDFSLEYAGGKGKKAASEEFINKKILILHFWKFN